MIKIYNINLKINLTKMLTINKATFYLNKRHIESLRSYQEFRGGIHDKSVVCIIR